MRRAERHRGRDGGEGTRELSCLKGVVRIEAVVCGDEGLWVITAEIPYDGTAMLSRCRTRQEADVLAMAVA
jgi:hypothetical protein